MDLEDLLPLDKEGEIIIPQYGQPGYRFNADASDMVKNRMEESLNVAMLNLVSLKRMLRPEVPGIVHDQAICDFLGGGAIAELTWNRI